MCTGTWQQTAEVRHLSCKSVAAHCGGRHLLFSSAKMKTRVFSEGLHGTLLLWPTPSNSSKKGKLVMIHYCQCTCGKKVKLRHSHLIVWYVWYDSSKYRYARLPTTPQKVESYQPPPPLFKHTQWNVHLVIENKNVASLHVCRVIRNTWLDISPTTTEKAENHMMHE